MGPGRPARGTLVSIVPTIISLEWKIYLMIPFLLMIALLMNNLQMLIYPVLRLHLLGLLIMQTLLLEKYYLHTLLINKERDSFMILDIIFAMICSAPIPEVYKEAM